MKHTLTFTVITLFLSWFTYSVWATVSTATPIEEIKIQVRDRHYFSVCATSFGNLQAHLDCHEEEQK